MKKQLVAAVATASMFFSATASAAVWYEVGDAGESIASAQTVAGGTSSISGSVAAGSADLFKFSWGGGAFYANTVGTTDFDSQLFLFTAAGVGIQGNDDGIAFAGPAYVSTNLAAGDYLIGISGFDYDPYSSAGLIFNSYPYETVYGPNNLSPLSYWSGGSSGGAYTIYFQQITSNGDPVGDPTPTGGDVPEPATLALLGVGLAGLGFGRRGKKKAQS